jgi:excisionase family DNA binding protein
MGKVGTGQAREWFTVPEAARILGIGKQAIYDAVREGRLRATGEGWGRRVHAQDILVYAIRTGKDAQAVIQRMQKEREVSWPEILLWILAGLGLAWLLSEFLKER